jgi:hypothetical protein
MTFAIWRRRVPPFVVVAGLGLVTAAGLVAGYLLLTHRPEPGKDHVRGPLPPGSYPVGPLPAGTVAPDLHAAGWINGSPPRPGTPGQRFILLDIWAHW